MSFRNILVPTDGSEFTKGAVEKALELALLSGGRITALYVLDKAVFSSSNNAAVVNAFESLEKEGTMATAYVAERGRELGIVVEVVSIEGSPAKVILQESERYDVIVMGTLGRTGLPKFIIGSVAEKVVQNAKCPVMVVKSSLSKKE